jgi:hypothetical protein
MGLYKGKVQSIFTGSYILPSADDKRRINISREKVRTKKREEKKELIYQEAHHTSSWTRGLKSYEKKSKITRRAKYVEKYQKTQYMRQVCL